MLLCLLIAGAAAAANINWYPYKSPPNPIDRNYRFAIAATLTLPAGPSPSGSWDLPHSNITFSGPGITGSPWFYGSSATTKSYASHLKIPCNQGGSTVTITATSHIAYGSPVQYLQDTVSATVNVKPMVGNLTAPSCDKNTFYLGESVQCNVTLDTFCSYTLAPYHNIGGAVTPVSGIAGPFGVGNSNYYDTMKGVSPGGSGTVGINFYDTWGNWWNTPTTSVTVLNNTLTVGSLTASPTTIQIGQKARVELTSASTSPYAVPIEVLWTVTGSGAQYAEVTPTGSNYKAIEVWSNQTSTINVSATVRMAANTEINQTRSASAITVTPAAPTIGSVSCPASRYQGQPGTCSVTASGSGGTVVVNWEAKNSSGQVVPQDSITGQTQSGTTYSMTYTPKSDLTTRTIKATACYQGTSNCVNAQTTMTVTANNLNMANLTASPSPLPLGHQSLVQLPSVTPAYGTYTIVGWTVTGGSPQYTSATPTGTNVNAIKAWTTGSSATTLTATVTARSNGDTSVTQSKSINISVVIPPPVVGTVSCSPSSRYLGQSGNCQTTVTGNYPLNVTWSALYSGGGTASSDLLTGATNSGSTYTVNYTPKTNQGQNRVVKAKACYSSYPTVCTEQQTTVPILANAISLANLTANVNPVLIQKHTLIQLPSASSTWGTFNLNWTVTGSGVTVAHQAATPIGANVSAREAWTTTTTAGTMTATVTATLNEDSAITASKSLTINVNTPTITVSGLTCTPSSRYLGQSGTCQATVTNTGGAAAMTWSSLVSGSPVGTDIIANAAQSGSTFSMTYTPKVNTSNRTVKARACVTAYPSYCHEQTITVPILANTITMANLTANPNPLAINERSKVQLPSVSATWGTLGAITWTVTGNAAGKINTTPDGGNVSAIEVWTNGTTTTTLGVTASTTLVEDASITASKSINIPVTIPAPTVGAVTCAPASRYLGQSGQCEVTVTGAFPLSVVWSKEYASGGNPLSDILSEADRSGDTFWVNYTPKTNSGDRKVKAKACYTDYPTICTEKDVTVQILDNTITLGDLTAAPPSLLIYQHGRVELPSASASWGTLSYSWTVTGGGVNSIAATPTGSNISAREIWSTSTMATTLTATLTAQIEEDTTVSASKSISVPVSLPTISVTGLTCTPSSRYLGQSGTCQATVTGDGQAAVTWLARNPSGVTVTTDVWGEQNESGGIFTIPYTPKTAPENRTVKARACLVAYPATCNEQTVEVPITANAITLADLTADPNPMSAAETSVVQLPSASTSWGTIGPVVWTVSGTGGQGLSVSPTGGNLSAFQVWSTAPGETTIRTTATVSLTEDISVTASKYIDIPVYIPAPALSSVNCDPVSVYRGQMASCAVQVTAIEPVNVTWTSYRDGGVVATLDEKSYPDSTGQIKFMNIIPKGADDARVIQAHVCLANHPAICSDAVGALGVTPNSINMADLVASPESLFLYRRSQVELPSVSVNWGSYSLTWTVTGGIPRKQEITPATGVAAVEVWSSSSSPTVLAVTATATLNEDATMQAVKTIEIPVEEPTVSIASMQCPAAVYLGQAGSCQATVNGDLPYNLTWQVIREGGLTAWADGIANQTAAGDTYAMEITPKTNPETRTVTARACLTDFLNICGEASAQITITPNTITLGELTATPESLFIGQQSIVELSSISAQFGTPQVQWTVTGFLPKKENQEPSAGNVSAVKVWGDTLLETTLTVTAAGKILEDPTVSVSKTVEIPVTRPPFPELGNIDCPASLYLGQSGVCNVAVNAVDTVTVNWFSYTAADVIENLGESAGAYRMNFTPKRSLNGRTVTAKACLANYTNYCSEKTATVEITPNAITLGDMTVTPSPLPSDQHGVVELTSAAAAWGTYSLAWQVTGAQMQSAQVQPTSGNAGALEVWVGEITTARVTATVTATLNEDSSIYASKSIAFDIVMPEPVLSEITCPTSGLYLGEEGVCEVTATGVMPLTVSWSSYDSATGVALATDYKTPIAPVNDTYGLKLVPKVNSNTRTVKARACYVSAPNVCKIAETSLLIRPNTITLGNLIASHESIFPGEQVTVELDAAAAEWGDVTVSWALEGVGGYITTTDPTAGNVSASRAWLNYGVATQLKVKATAVLNQDAAVKTNKELVLTIKQPVAPTITSVSCPASLYLGQSGVCELTASAVDEVNVTWAALRTLGGMAYYDVFTTIETGNPDVARAEITPKTNPETRLVQAKACLKRYPYMCSTGTAQMEITPNPIVLGDVIISPEELLPGETATVELLSVSALYGTPKIQWKNLSLYSTQETVEPTGGISTVKVGSERMTASQITVELTAYIEEDKTVKAVKTLTIPFVSPDIVIDGINCPAVAYVNQPVACSVTAHLDPPDRGEYTLSYSWAGLSAVWTNGTAANPEVKFWQTGNKVVTAIVLINQLPLVKKSINATVAVKDVPSVNARIDGPSNLFLTGDETSIAGHYTAAIECPDEGICDFVWVTPQGEVPGSEIDMTFEAEGNLTVQGRATMSDPENSTFTQMVSKAVRVNRLQPPVLEVVGPTTATRGREVVLNASARQNQGLGMSIEWAYAGGVEAGSSIRVTPVETGPLMVVCKATLVDYPEIFTERQFTLNVEDPQLPQVTLTSSAAGVVYAPAYVVVNGGMIMPLGLSSYERYYMLSHAVYNWKINGEEAGTGSRLVKTFNEPGDYNVELSIQFGDISTAPKSTVVVIAEAPPPAVTITEYRPRCEDLPMAVTYNLSISDPIRTRRINSVSWSVNGEDAGTLVRTFHTYTQPGAYEVKVRVAMNDGKTVEKTFTTEVTEGTIPTAQISVIPISKWGLKAPTTLFLRGVVGWGCRSERITETIWSFNDEETEMVGFQSINKTFGEPGPQQVGLKLVTESGKAITGSTVLDVSNNEAPVCTNIGEEDSTGNYKTLRAVCSDADSPALTYQWSIDGSPTSVYQGSINISTYVKRDVNVSVAAVDEVGAKSSPVSVKIQIQ